MRQGARTFNKWRQGSSASGDPDVTEYNSENAQVYENGTLGPRPGWREITPSGGSRTSAESTDPARGLMWYQESDGDEHLMVIFRDTSDGNSWKFDTFDLATETWSTGQTLADVASGAFSLYPNDYPFSALLTALFDGSILSAIGPHILLADASSPGTVAAVTTADGDAREVTVNRERAYYWGIASTPGRVYFSEAADYANIGAANSFDVNADKDSYAGAPIGMWSVKNALLIAMKDNRWATLTGASPENGSFKELGRDVVPVHGTATVVDNQVFFLSPTGAGVVIATPGFVEAESLRYLSPLAHPGGTEDRPSNDFWPKHSVGDDTNGFLFLPGLLGSDLDQLLAVERTNGVFNLSRWDMGPDVTDVVFSRGRPNEMYAVLDFGTDWDFYSRNHTLNRPGNSADSKSRSLTDEGSSVVVDLGEIVASQGMRVRPTKVVIDAQYWKGGSYDDPSIAVDCTILGTEGGSPEDVLPQASPATTSWGNSTGNEPSQRRISIPLPQGQFGTRFRTRLTFDNLALDAVEVQYEETEDAR